MVDKEECAAEGADNPSPDEQQRLEAARSLLERNGALVFKLNGLAALRRTAGGHPPSAEERAMLAEAQRSLQDAASLLPPRILVPAGLTKRLRQQLARCGSEEEGAHKRRLVITQLKEGQADARQAALDGLHLEDALGGSGDQRKQEMEQLEGLLFANQARLASVGQLGQQLAAEAPPLLQPPPQQEVAGQGSSGAPPEGLLPFTRGAPALAGSPGQQLGGGMLSQAFLHGLRPQPYLDDLLGSGSLGALGSGRLSGDLGLVPLPALGGGMGGIAPLTAPQMQPAAPRLGGSALGGERLAGEDAFLLSKAYSSMTTEQKERLAAQPPEVRHYVLRERMRRTREQLQVMHGQQAAGSGGETAPPSRPASGMLPHNGLWPGDAAMLAGHQQDDGAWVGQSSAPTPMPGGEPQGGAQQQQQLLAWQQQAAPQTASPPPDLGFTADSQLLQQEQQQRALTLPLASLGQLLPGTLAPAQQLGAQMPLLPGQLGLGSGGLGALLGGSLGGVPPAGPPAAGAKGLGSSRFVTMDEEQRLAHLRSLKKRQEEWLEQQRLAAAQLAQHGGS